MPIIKFKHFDKYRAEGVLKGVFLSGCVRRGDGSSFRRKAHAHTDRPGQDFPGWICVRSRHRLMSATGKPSLLMWHELAHLISRQGHTDKWRKTMRELCGRVWPSWVAKKPVRFGHRHKWLLVGKVPSGIAYHCACTASRVMYVAGVRP